MWAKHCKKQQRQLVIKNSAAIQFQCNQSMCNKRKRVAHWKALKQNKRKNNEQRWKSSRCTSVCDWSSSEHNTKHLTAKVCAKYKKKHVLAMSHRAIDHIIFNTLSLSSGSLCASFNSIDISFSTGCSLVFTATKSCTKSHSSTKREYTASLKSHPKLNRTLQ